MTHLKNLILALTLLGCATDDLPDEQEDEEEAAGGALDSHGESTAAPTHNLLYCPGGSGGPGGKPIPAPRDCTKEATWELCYACCDWNEKHSWGETCRRLPRRSRGECWRRLENELRPQCQRGCKLPGGPITTVAP